MFSEHPGFQDIQYLYYAFDAYATSASGADKNAALLHTREVLNAAVPVRQEHTGAEEIRCRIDAIIGMQHVLGFSPSAIEENTVAMFRRILAVM
jgi:hypothetical protein